MTNTTISIEAFIDESDETCYRRKWSETERQDEQQGSGQHKLSLRWKRLLAHLDLVWQCLSYPGKNLSRFDDDVTNLLIRDRRVTSGSNSEARRAAALEWKL